jgi:vacuolar-type H+-ATPase subunit E/Vma4
MKARFLLFFPSGLGVPKLTQATYHETKKESKMARKGFQKEDLTTVEGFVEEVDLENGDTGLVIFDGENDYYVVPDKKGRKLENHIEEEVEVSGILSEKDGDLWLKVTFFQLVEYSDDSDDYYCGDDRWSA